MNYQTIETGSQPEIQVSEILGSLYVKSWERPEVIIKADPQEVKVEKAPGGLRVQCQGDLVLQVPIEARLVVQAVRGDAQFKNLKGVLKIETVNGSLDLKNMAAIQVNSVFGDCRAKRVAGDLHIQQVTGSMYARSIEGQCQLGQVMGDITLREASGEIKVQAMGFVRLQLDNLEGNIQAQAGGDVHCVLRGEVDAQLQVTSGGGSIRVNLPGLNEMVEENNYSASLGAGTHTIQLSAGGEVFILGRSSVPEEDMNMDEDMARMSEELNQQVAQQIETQMERMLSQFNEQLGRLSEQLGRGSLTTEQTERVMERARAQSERAAERAQEKIRRAQERLTQRMEANRKRDEVRGRGRVVIGGRGWNFDFPGTPTPPAPPSAPASDEERLMILRMLEEKKISLEEAEQLLSALEGKR